MTTTLGYSMIENNNDEKQKGKIVSDKVKNKTIKKRDDKVKNFLKSMKKTLSKRDEDSDDEDDIGSEYISTGSSRNNQTPNNNETLPKEDEDARMLKIGLQQQQAYLKNENDETPPYYNNYVSPYSGTQPYTPNYKGQQDNSNISENELMKKLNYVVHMLEEQHDEKTGSITEELILYTFLGIFVIFIVDSFAKTSKYKR